MTPQQQAEQTALNEKVKKLPVINDLKDGQAEILATIEEEKAQNQEAFNKGNIKFSKIEEELGELRAEVSEMKTQIATGFKQISNDINRHILDSANSEIATLNKKLDRKAQVKDGVIVTLVGGILLAIATSLIYGSIASADLMASYPDLPNLIK